MSLVQIRNVKVKDGDGYHYEYVVTDANGATAYRGTNAAQAKATYYGMLQEEAEENAKSADENQLEQKQEEKTPEEKTSEEKADEAYKDTVAEAEQKSDEQAEANQTTMDKEMEKLETPVENKIEEAQKKTEESSKNTAKKVLQTIAASGGPSIVAAGKKRNRGKAEINRHTEEGAIYVKKQNVVLDEPINTQNSEINSRVDETLKKESKKLSESMSATMAAHKTMKKNNKIIAQAKKIYSAIKTAEAKAKNIAFTLLQQIKLIIMSKLGINLPI